MASRIADERILIIDFGAQYAQLIARRIRELRVYCEIVRHDIPWEHVQARNAKGLIFSGGPGSVYDTGAPKCDPRLMSGEIPVLGICYGMQLACDALGGRVDSAPSREYGRARCQIVQPNLLLKGVSAETDVWMSHGDIVSAVPAGFEALATTSNSPIAAVKHTSLPVYGLQFHPEVTHTTEGTSMLRNFAYEVCGCAGTWELSDLIKESVEEIKSKVGSNRVICGLSGGVDSSVTAALISKAIGPQLSCILVDHGLLRQNEQQTVINEFSSHFRTDLHVVDAKERFLSSLRGITEPQEKRRRIGQAFIECFKAEAVNIADSKFLAQGTLYPDVIESGAAPDGPAATIKLHHNVGGLPDELGFELIEPLRNLFKDEVRRMGTQLGLPDEIVWKHPFPGPGLAVRCLGEVTEARLDVLRQADAIVVGEIKDANLYRETSQVFAVLLPVQSVGVMGDCRTYEDTIIVRCVNTDDFMTADWTRLPYDLLAKISSRIINEVVGVNRVAYDISSKPPATIEWE